MKEDELTDFERAEYYKERMKAKRLFWIIVSILMFFIGFMVARATYIYYYEYYK